MSVQMTEEDTIFQLTLGFHCLSWSKYILFALVKQYGFQQFICGIGDFSVAACQLIALGAALN